VSELQQQILGTWALVRAELGGAQGGSTGGESMPPEIAARVEIEFDAESAYRVRFAGEISDAGHFEIFAQTESEAPPHHPITLHGKVGTNAGRTLPGICQLRGDRLRLCLALEGDAPPTGFASPPAANAAPYYLVTYRRKTPPSALI